MRGRRERGSGTPSWGDSRRTEGRGPGQPGDLLSTRGPGRTQMRDRIPARLALQVLRDQVGLVMLGEMVTSHEALLTLGTLETFVPWEDKMHVTQSPRADMVPADNGVRVRCEGHPVKLSSTPCSTRLPLTQLLPRVYSPKPFGSSHFSAPPCDVTSASPLTSPSASPLLPCLKPLVPAPREGCHLLPSDLHPCD